MEAHFSDSLTQQLSDQGSFLSSLPSSAAEELAVAQLWIFPNKMYIPKSLSSAFLRPTSYVSGPWSWPLRCLTVCGLSKIRTLAFQNVIQPNTVHLKLSSFLSDIFFVTIVKPIVNGNLQYGFRETSHFQWNLRFLLWNPSLIFTTT